MHSEDLTTADIVPPDIAAIMDEHELDVHTWFGLSYTNYAVLHRTLLQSMPLDWQLRFTRCMQELEYAVEAADIQVASRYTVGAVDPDTRRFMRDPVPHYNRGRTRVEWRRQ